ncbi:hypothetical protein [Pedobacter sp. GR22-10]|uniref:hypothetical protein n=1 Tax=Pedobacter sp. GR22-10 TaxID=2994472 RepID=UPI002246B37C|nr:hypothetical protein [Pedobacter sp. GR22-10]MCX2431621.1 hypothetical protein [Pedobacter sp. GR22-10]
MKGSITNIIQQKNIQALKYYQGLFHPTYQNNYTIELVNKSIDLSPLIAKKKKDLNFLNIASYNLCAFMKICLADIRNNTHHDYSRVESIEVVLEKWGNAIANGNSFLTYDFAKESIAVLEKLDPLLLFKLKSPKYEVIPYAFKNIPKPFRAFVRLNNYSSESDSSNMLSSLFNYFAENPDVFKFVERIEVAKKELPFETVSTEEYPLFSVFFNYDTVESPSNEAVIRTVEHFVDMGSSALNMSNSGDYSYHVAKNTTLSQGFKNYKRYLLLMDILDDVYHREKNHAFVLPE